MTEGLENTRLDRLIVSTEQGDDTTPKWTAEDVLLSSTNLFQHEENDVASPFAKIHHEEGDTGRIYYLQYDVIKRDIVSRHEDDLSNLITSWLEDWEQDNLQISSRVVHHEKDFVPAEHLQMPELLEELVHEVDSYEEVEEESADAICAHLQSVIELIQCKRRQPVGDSNSNLDQAPTWAKERTAAGQDGAKLFESPLRSEGAKQITSPSIESSICIQLMEDKMLKIVNAGIKPLVTKIDANTAAIALTFPQSSETKEKLTPAALGALIQSIAGNMKLMAIRVNEATDLVDTFRTELSADLTNAEAGEYAREQDTIAALDNLSQSMQVWFTEGDGKKYQSEGLEEAITSIDEISEELKSKGGARARRLQNKGKTTLPPETLSPLHGRFYLPSPLILRPIVQSSYQAGSAQKADRVYPASGFSEHFLTLYMNREIDPWTYVPPKHVRDNDGIVRSGATLAVKLLFTEYTSNTGEVTFPFEGMSKNEEGYYCLHGENRSLLQEAREFLVEGLRRWMEDETVQVSMLLTPNRVDLTQEAKSTTNVTSTASTGVPSPQTMHSLEQGLDMNTPPKQKAPHNILELSKSTQNTGTPSSESGIQPKNLESIFQLDPTCTHGRDPPGLDISVFQQASSSLPPTPTALPEVTDKPRVMLEKDSLVSTEVEMPKPKGSLPEIVVAMGISEMKKTGKNSRPSSGQAPDEGIEKEKQLTDEERKSTNTTALVPEKEIISLSTAQVEKLSGMKDAELQQTQGQRSNAGEIEEEQTLVEMEAEQQMLDTSKTECGEPSITVQIEPASKATAKTPVIKPTVEFQGVSTRRAKVPLKSPVDEIEHTLHRGRRANKSKVVHLELATSISMLSPQAESAEGKEKQLTVTMPSKVTPKLGSSKRKSEEKVPSKIVPRKDKLQPAINTIFEHVTKTRGNGNATISKHNGST